MKKTAIIGLGNSLRQDDGVGILLLQKLKEKKHLIPKNVDLIDAGIPGMNLIHLIEPYKKIIFIDAVNLQKKPGETKFFKPSDVISKNNKNSVSDHETDLLKIIEIYKKLNKNNIEFFIFGVQPKNTGYGEDLSSVVMDKFEFILDVLIKNLDEF